MHLYDLVQPAKPKKLPPATPYKRRNKEERTPTPTKRRVVFNLKMNVTQEFYVKAKVTDMGLPPKPARKLQIRGVLKKPT